MTRIFIALASGAAAYTVMTTRRALAALVLVTFSVTGCGGGGGGGSASDGDTSTPSTYTASSGVAQKGPLQQGSIVTAQELDSNLSPTGKQYSYQVTSNLGTFSPASTFTSRYIGLNASGYYFDEVANAISGGTITLNGYSDLAEESVLNVNLLTTLAYQRIQTLMTKSSMTFTAARAQAEREVLTAFHIPAVASYGAFDTFDLSKGRDGDHILAAISSLFVYGNTSGNVSALIASVQSDIGANGSITNATTSTQLWAAAKAIDPSAVAENLTNEYSAAGVTFTAADIGDWLDPNGTGIVSKFTFDQPDASASSVFTFPAYVTELFAGASLSASGGQLLLNGSPVTGPVIPKATDTLGLSPGLTGLRQGLLTVRLTVGGSNVASVTFVSGDHTLATLQSIKVTPISPTFGVQTNLQLTATGTYADGTTADVTRQGTWASSNSSIATVGATTGVVTGIALGMASITATAGPVTATVTVTIAPPTWHIATPPATERVSIAALLLPDGRVIVTGQEFASLDPATAEVYDPATDSWMPPATIAAKPIAQQTMTLLPNGKVLFAGGSDTSGPVGVALATAQLYDPASNSFSPTGSLLMACSGHTATLLPNGLVLVAGGGADCGSSAELYDPIAGTWSLTGNLSTPHEGATATLLPNGKVLIAGGYGTRNTELYDPATGTWSPTGSLSSIRVGTTATLLPDGKVLVVGGFDTTTSTTLSSVEIYDPALATWSITGSLSTARSSQTATLLPSGIVLVTGGSPASASTESFDPSTGAWSPAPSLLVPPSFAAAVLLTSGRVMVVGRYTELYY